MTRVLPVISLISAVVVSVVLVYTGNAKPEYLLTIFGIVSAASVVVYQLGEQQRTSLSLQRENARQALKLKVYEQLLEKVVRTIDAGMKSSWYVRSIEASIKLHLGGAKWLNSATISGLSKRHYKASDATIELIGQLERWEISLTSADIFRIALSATAEDIRLSQTELFKSLLPVLPSNKLAASNIPVASKEKLQEILDRMSKFLKACDTQNSYLFDLIVEGQNELVGDLFDRRVKKREPLDPRYKVISETNRKELLRYFSEETNQGLSMAEARKHVLDSLRSGSGA